MFQDMELSDHFLKFQRKVIRTNQGDFLWQFDNLVSAEDWNLAGHKNIIELIKILIHCTLQGDGLN